MQGYLNRVLIGLVLFISAYFIVKAAPIVFILVLLVLSLLTSYEFKSLSNKMGIYPVANWIYFFNAIFILLPTLVIDNYNPNFVFVFQVCILLSAYVVIFSRILVKTNITRFEDITASLWAVLHLGLLPSFYVWLRLLDNGFAFVFTIIMSISANDVGCLLFGKLFGKHKLAPQISPGKTVAGSIGGLLCGTLAFWGSAEIFDFHLKPDLWLCSFQPFQNLLSSMNLLDCQPVIVILLGFLLSIVAQVGDLLVSVLKRAADVKDSGKILFSHGGVLDRVDSHFFAAWIAFFIFTCFLH